MNTKFILRAFALFAASSIMTGCSEAKDDEFWRQYESRYLALEANLPSSLADLAENADMMILGTVESVRAGKMYPAEPSPVQTVNVTLSVAKVTGDTRGRPFVVEWMRASDSDLKAAPRLRGTYIFLLDHDPRYDTLVCSVGSLCVLGVSDDGTVTSPLNSGQVLELPVQPGKYSDVEALYDDLARG